MSLLIKFGATFSTSLTSSKVVQYCPRRLDYLGSAAPSVFSVPASFETCTPLLIQYSWSVIACVRSEELLNHLPFACTVCMSFELGHLGRRRQSDKFVKMPEPALGKDPWKIEPAEEYPMSNVSDIYDDPAAIVEERGIRLGEASDMYGDIKTAEDYGYVTRG